MAPVVHGLGAEYEGRVDFFYLDVSQPEVEPLAAEFGFEATPHFFLRSPDGRVAWSHQGAVSRERLVEAIDTVLRRAGG
jgi:thioredoxin-like negative regulator of GroEL